MMGGVSGNLATITKRYAQPLAGGAQSRGCSGGQARMQGAGLGERRGPACQLPGAGGQFADEGGSDFWGGDDAGPPCAADRRAGRSGGEGEQGFG